MMAIDFTSGAWQQIAAFAAEQLSQARQRNDNPELTADQTAANRGEIRFIKRLLGLPAAAARETEGPVY